MAGFKLKARLEASSFFHFFLNFFPGTTVCQNRTEKNICTYKYVRLASNNKKKTAIKNIECCDGTAE